MTTKFCMWGIHLNLDQIIDENILINKNIKTTHHLIKEVIRRDLSIYLMTNKYDLYAGLDIQKMKSEESRELFQERAEVALEKIFNLELDCDWRWR